MTTTAGQQDHADGRQALSGIKVLDLGQAFMGPYCGHLLQRLGADVVKVEPPQGEPYRRPTARKGVEAVQFGLLNAGKRSLCIDLKQPEGRELFIELAKSADVVLQNYAPETFERLVGIDALLTANPRLIVASGSGYGSTGPYRALRAMDLTIQAMAGVMATTGFADGPPTRTGPAVVDIMGGSHLTSAILAALVQRGVTGRGQHVEVALYDAIFPSLASNIGAFFDSDGESPERTGNRHGGLAVAPYNAYATADGWIAILCLHDRHWSAACGVIGRPELADDPRFSSNAARTRHLDELDAIVTEWTAARPTDVAAEALTAVDVPCAPVKSLAEVIDDPHLAARGMLEHHSNEERDWWTFGSPLRLSGSPATEDNVPARLGQHSRVILGERLGLPEDRIEELVTAGLIVGEPVPEDQVGGPEGSKSLAYADTADISVDPGDLGIHRLELPTPFPIGPVNAYLIEDDPLTLVDAGPNSATTLMVLEQRLAELGHRVEDLGLVLVTHQHLDHIGLVGIVAQRSGADVVALDALAPWLADYDRSMRRQYRYAGEVMEVNGVPREVCAAVRALSARLAGWGAPVTVTTPMAPGEQVTLRDRTLTVLHRPGHSPSDTVFLDERHRVAFGGDHLLPEVSSNPVITRPLDGATGPRPQTLVTYLASLDATAASDLDLVLPGHGGAIHDHRALIAERLVGHDHRRDRLHELITERPRSAYELAIELWDPDVAAGQALLTVSEVLGHVDLLLNDGQVREERDPDGPIRFSAV